MVCSSVEVNYPKTKLLSIIAPEIGYIMCGVLYIEAMDALHPEKILPPE